MACDELSWSHYRLLMQVDNPQALEWYMREAASQQWSTRQLDRQISALYYERLLASRKKAPVRKEARKKLADVAPEEFIRDPYVLEFLNLKDYPALRESAVEQAIIDNQLTRLVEFLTTMGPRAQWNGKGWSKARVSVMTAISRNRSAVIAAIPQTDVEDIEGRLKQIVAALKQRNVILLPGGTLERYLPKYAGDHYERTDDAKRQAVGAEIEEMAKAMTPAEMAARYGELYEAVCALPSKASVDVERVLRDYLSHYIHDLQVAVVNNPTWLLDQVQVHMNTIQRATIKVFSVRELIRGQHKEFNAIIAITEMFGQKQRLVRLSHQANAGMGDFKIEDA